MSFMMHSSKSTFVLAAVYFALLPMSSEHLPVFASLFKRTHPSCLIPILLHLAISDRKRPVRHIMGSAPLTAVTFKDDGITVALGTSTGNVELYDLRMPEARMVTFAAGEGQPVDSLAYQSVSRSGSSSSSKTTSQVKPLPR